MRYKLRAPDPLASARCLRSLDDGRTSFRPGRAAPREWDGATWTYKTVDDSSASSIVRAQLTSQALPVHWRNRDRATQAIWPPESDIVTWAGIGAMHALAPLYPRPTFPIFKTEDQRPHALAYLAAYAAVFGAYAMTPTQDDATTTIHIPEGGIDPVLAAAWVLAAKNAPILLRDSKNESTGHYTSADGVADQARTTLANQNLLWAIVGDRIRPQSLAPSDIGARAYVGDVELDWMLVHSSGAVLRGTSTAAVVAMKKTPHDKAVQAAKTYLAGNVLRFLLCFVREDKHSTDMRLDREAEAENQIKLCSDATANAIGSICHQIASIVNVSHEAVFKGAWKGCGYPPNADVTRPANLTPEEAIKVHEWLANDMKRFAKADDQRQPGEDSAP